MNGVAQIALVIDAVILICVAPVEMFLLDRRWAKRFLGVAFTNRGDVELWAFCIGARNLLGSDPAPHPSSRFWPKVFGADGSVSPWGNPPRGDVTLPMTTAMNACPL